MDKSKFKVARITLFLIIFYVLCSCNHTEKKYYDTGELFSETRVSDLSLEFSKYKSYYKSGIIKEECLLYNTNIKRDPIPYDCYCLEDMGKTINGHWIYGNWISYYEDGTIKENAYFHNGELVIYAENGHFPQLKRKSIHLKFDGMKNEMTSEMATVFVKKSSDTIPFRLYIEDTPQVLYSINCNSNYNASIHKSKNDNFSHELYVPQIPDTISLVLQFMNDDGVILTNDSVSRKVYTIIVEN